MSKYDALKELEQMQDPFVFADEIAPVFGVKPETLRRQAKHPNGKPLPFKFVILGEKVYFNRLSFLEYVTGKKRNR